ncbi:MAG: patatin-like phospholipase family protein [Bacillota bacterium]
MNKKKLIILALLLNLLLVTTTPSLAIKEINLDEETYLIEDYKRFQKIKSPKVAIALSGGGARALANIGVLKALIEEQVPIDLITGTSMGSIIGTMYGSGLSIEQIEDIATKNPFAQLFNINFTSSKSLLKTEQVNNFIERIVPHKRLENFRTPTALLSFDLTSGSKYLTTTGQISKVIQGTYSIPHYFPPYHKNNHYLIDPGILEMSPAKSAKVLGADFIIATTAFNQVSYNKYDTPSRSLGRFITLLQRKNANKILNDYADIIVHSDVMNYSFMDFKQVQKLIDLGYQATMEQMPKLKKQLKEKGIKLDYQDQRREVNLEQEFNLLRNDRLLNRTLIINPIFQTGKNTNFLTHESLITYSKQTEYGLQAEKEHLDIKLLSTTNSAQDLNLKLRWRQLTPNTDWLLKTHSKTNDISSSDFKTELKYYQIHSNYSLGLGHIDKESFVYTGSQYQFGSPKKQWKGELDLVYSENNELNTIFSQKTNYFFTDTWEVKAKSTFNNTDLVPSPLIYRGLNAADDTKLQAGIDLIYNYNFADPIELNALQLTNIKLYAFIDYQDKFDDSYAYGIGNKTNFDLFGLKPIDLETYVAYDKQQSDFKYLIKLDYKF